jgi:hypothetical protein
MQGTPFEDKVEGAARKLSLGKTRADLDSDLELSILRMEMRRSVVQVVHVDDDSKESANLRHLILL